MKIAATATTSLASVPVRLCQSQIVPSLLSERYTALTLTPLSATPPVDMQLAPGLVFRRSSQLSIGWFHRSTEPWAGVTNRPMHFWRKL
ncbi:hypothetical protein CFIMG_007340RA00001 [Ceratocystis fimbriata CBS 114723]|uniref:Uncharacterized protein n=1 Tax=Ceratocystis fimbriata CBS 114723 TaxID=1035309 RepID=A0A2C5WYL8_9PEZI|nr:hypothetical protein CFIMG_007340RA00001 [Ceratocystis fimbriata CBS 114723]